MRKKIIDLSNTNNISFSNFTNLETYGVHHDEVLNQSFSDIEDAFDDNSDSERDSLQSEEGYHVNVVLVNNVSSPSTITIVTKQRESRFASVMLIKGLK